MTPQERVNKQAAVMLAYAEGKEIEYMNVRMGVKANERIHPINDRRSYEGVREMSYEYNSGFSDGLSSANQKIAEITKQRDELLAALERFTLYPGCTCDRDYEIANAAIASVKESK